MHILYLDDSGSAQNPNEEHLVLGGISVSEAQTHWVTQELDKIALSIDAKDPHSVEFHASEIFGDRQRGLIILDKSSYETSLQDLSKNFRSFGTRWNFIRHLAETPVFVDSKASRVVQLADHIAYAVFRRYEASDA